MHTDGIINLQNVSFYRGGRAIFEDLNCAIAAGKITAIMGPSGTGKTTLLRLISGQLQPHKGQVFLFDQDMAKIKQKQLRKSEEASRVNF